MILEPELEPEPVSRNRFRNRYVEPVCGTEMFLEPELEPEPNVPGSGSPTLAQVSLSLAL